MDSCILCLFCEDDLLKRCGLCRRATMLIFTFSCRISVIATSNSVCKCVTNFCSGMIFSRPLLTDIFLVKRPRYVLCLISHHGCLLRSNGHPLRTLTAGYNKLNRWVVISGTVSALTLMVWRQEGHPARKKLTVGMLIIVIWLMKIGANDLHMSQRGCHHRRLNYLLLQRNAERFIYWYRLIARLSLNTGRQTITCSMIRVTSFGLVHTKLFIIIFVIILFAQVKQSS